MLGVWADKRLAVAAPASTPGDQPRDLPRERAAEVPTLREHGTDHWGNENARLFQKDATTMSLAQLFGVIAIGVLTWFVTHFIGKPFLKFRKLRGEAIKRMTEFGNVRAQWRETHHGELEQMDIPTSEQQRLQQAASIDRELASQFRAFAKTNGWLSGSCSGLATTGSTPARGSSECRTRSAQPEATNTPKSRWCRPR
jgi:hypothetical protein